MKKAAWSVLSQQASSHVWSRVHTRLIGRLRTCVSKIAEFIKGTLLIAEAIRQEFEPGLDR